MSKAVGIDLGTTNSVVAHLRKTESRVIDNQDYEPLTPSVVHLTEHGEWVVGKHAKKSAAVSEVDAASTVFSIKRFMGRDYDDHTCAEDIAKCSYKVAKAENGEADVVLRNRQFSPPEISAFILESVKKSAEDYLDEEVPHAVITVPAYFGNRQRDATRLAGQLAGLNVLRIIPEPNAAALAYGIASESDEPKTVLVYDLGGGTFDVTVMFIGAGVFEDQGKSGDMHLGGDNFDYKIVDWMLEQIRIQYGVDLRNTANKGTMFQLKEAAEEAKIRLSRTTRTQIVIPALSRIDGKILNVECELKREDFNNMIQPLVDRSIDLVYEAIKLARTTPDGIDAILLVGGSTGVPLVDETVRSIFGDVVIRGQVNPMHCVAQGAAIETTLVKDVSSGADPSIVQCDACGAFNLKTRADCRHCAKKFSDIYKPPDRELPPPPTVECPNPQCGKENPTGIAECVFCHTPLLVEGGVIEIPTTPHPFGVQVLGDRMEIIIPEATPYPMKEPKTKLLKTTYDGQELIRLPVYEGRDPVASKNQLLGEAQGRLAAGLPEGTNIEVALSLDGDGVLYITASLPDRPGTEIKASMKWQRDLGKEPVEPNGGNGEPDDEGWKSQAQFMLFQAGAIKDEGEAFIPSEDIDRLIQLAAGLLMALQSDNQRTGQRMMNDMEPLLGEHGMYVMLGMMRAISKNPDLRAQIPTKLRQEFDGLMDKLEKLLEQADQAKQQRNFAVLVMSVVEGKPIFDQIWNMLGVVDKDLLSGLLRGSADLAQ